MVETAGEKPNTIENYRQITDLPPPPLVGELRTRFDEVLDAFRREKREKRHAQRVKVLEEAISRGEIVFTSRIETES